MKTYQTNVVFDETLTDIVAINSQAPSGDFQGLVTHAVKLSGTVPDAVAGVYALGASVHNVATGVWYRNTGTTASPVFTVWAV
jgi:hypothetical protein